jgi:hypothetical protein
LRKRSNSGHAFFCHFFQDRRQKSVSFFFSTLPESLFQKTQKHFNSIESPLKTEGSSDSPDGTKYIKNSREFFYFEPFETAQKSHLLGRKKKE